MLKSTLEQAAIGVEKEIKYQRQTSCDSCSGSGASEGSGKVMCSTCGGIGQVATNQGFISIRRTCPTCQGSGVTIENPCKACSGQGRLKSPDNVKVQIPPGVSDGNRLCSRGRGDAGAMGGSSGDLYVDVHIKDHSKFDRDEDDLFHDILIPFTLATLVVLFKSRLSKEKLLLKFQVVLKLTKHFELKTKACLTCELQQKGRPLCPYNNSHSPKAHQITKRKTCRICKSIRRRRFTGR